MLVLSRKKEEVIHIGDNIEIIVTQIQNGKVRLGIKAPKDVPIIRGELMKSETVEKHEYSL